MPDKQSDTKTESVKRKGVSVLTEASTGLDQMRNQGLVGSLQASIEGWAEMTPLRVAALINVLTIAIGVTTTMLFNELLGMIGLVVIAVGVLGLASNGRHVL